MALQYPTGSLAAQPVRQIPSSKRRGTAASDAPMRQVMSDMQSGRGLTMPPMSQMPGGGQTRQDRIIAARMDGSFDTKRNQFNTANAGKLVMDEAGNIAPGTTSAPAAVNLVPAANPVSAPTAPPASPPIAKLPAPAQMAANVAAGIVGGPAAATMSQVAGPTAKTAVDNLKKQQDRNFSRHRVALERLHGPMSAAVSARSRERQRQDGDLNTLNPDAAKILQQPAPAARPATSANPAARRSAGGELVQPGTPMNPNARWSKPAIPSAVTPPMAAQAPAAAPPMTPAAPVPATSITTTDQAWAKKQKTMRPTPMSGPGAPTLEGRAQALQDAARLSQSTQGPMPRVSTTSSMPAKFVAPPGGFSPEFHRQFDPVPTAPQPAVAPATPAAVPPAKVTPPARLNAAQAQAVKNPQGLSARMNPPGAKPVPLSQDPIAKPVIAGLTAVGQAVSAGGGMVSTALKSQAAKNPTGLAAKLGRLTGLGR